MWLQEERRWGRHMDEAKMSVQVIRWSQLHVCGGGSGLY